jgi:uncharacterized glyoxalase superfamily protein PhnB
MATSDSTRLPSVGDVIGQVLGRVSRERRPLLLAIAERMAADRYRGWARQVLLAADQESLRACAAREEDIATRVEGLHPDATAIQRALRDEMPELDTVTRDLFDRPLAQQLRIQAEGERLGAMTWTALAERETDARRKRVLLECAELEIASAETLEGLLAAGLATGGSPVIPTMRYHDAPRIVDWLCDTFGFRRHLVVPDGDGGIAHAELAVGGGMIMLGSWRDDEWGALVKTARDAGAITQSVYVVIPTVDAHYAHAKAAGAEIVQDLEDKPYGGRGYSARDPEGQLWSFGSFDPWA